MESRRGGGARSRARAWNPPKLTELLVCLLLALGTGLGTAVGAKPASEGGGGVAPASGGGKASTNGSGVKSDLSPNSSSQGAGAADARPKASKRAPLGPVCTSKGGRFEPFPKEERPPQKAPKAAGRELSFCRVYRGKTCCGRPQTDAALLTSRMLTVGGEGSPECVALWEALECAICDPVIGTLPGPPPICGSFCARAFAACRDAFFASDHSSQALLPCSPRDTICSRLSEWAADGAAFCHLAGFRVVNGSKAHGGGGGGGGGGSGLEEGDATSCFDGKPLGADHLSRSSKFTPSVTVRDGWRGPKSGGCGKGWRQFLWEEGRRAWLEMGDNVSWVVAGLVLSAGGAYYRWCNNRNRRKRAAVFAQRSLAEARARQQALYRQVLKE